MNPSTHIVLRCAATSPVKLIIQIPCLNERETLAQTFSDLPRSIDGVDEIEVLIIDDGSTDGTSELAEQLGIHHIVRFAMNRGLAAGFMAGIDACLRLGADIIVNTDADNQYRGAEIPRLVAPILEGRADLVIGDRQTDRIEHFSPLKKVLQRWGSRLIRRLSATDVADSPSGFRAVSRKAALQLFVHNRFTYTLETVIQAGRRGLAVENVKITTNPKTRESRLFRSIPDYLRRAGPVMFRAYAMYRPVQLVGWVAAILLVFGLALGVRFLYFYLQNPDYSGYIQSLIVATGAVVVACILVAVALLAELIAANRRLVEEVLMRVRRIETELAQRAPGVRPEGIHTTGAKPWRNQQVHRARASAG
nr:glycosyltransferase family 2 protein [Sorangium cellulosum]